MYRYQTEDLGIAREFILSFIKAHEDLLKGNDLDAFYEKVIPEGYYPDDELRIGGLCTKFFILNGIDVFSLVSKLYPGMFFETDLLEVDIPGKFKNIPEYCFRRCKLYSIGLQEGIEEINYKALAGTHLSNIYLPDSLKVFDMTSLNDVRPYVTLHHDPLMTNEGIVIDAPSSCTFINGTVNHNITINRRDQYQYWQYPDYIRDDIITTNDLWAKYSPKPSINYSEFSPIEDWVKGNKSWNID